MPIQPSTSPHGQYTSDPIAHFKNIPWCAKLLSDKSIIHVAIPDRRPKLDGEYTLVKEALNSGSTVRACITYFRLPKRTEGLRPGEEKKNPFIEINTLLDLGNGVNGFAKTCHGGFMATVFDEVMGTAAWQQSGDNGAYTIDMALKFKKPLFTPTIVRCVGGVVKKEGRRIVLKAVFIGEDGTVYSEAEAVFLEMNRNIGKAAEEKYGTMKAKL
ncbi:Verlamelin biosynthesis protein B [Lachnellula cervina]|uniref:Verlamelin biosynthesis protein B n=1 Tax=Lachnellula cervina TaxID=1316786 RepID=A0A7D8UXJ1_9HELO|nr:Verlamelin biosynthesis protein B [Lachnellula cervina]